MRHHVFEPPGVTHRWQDKNHGMGQILIRGGMNHYCKNELLNCIMKTNMKSFNNTSQRCKVLITICLANIFLIMLNISIQKRSIDSHPNGYNNDIKSYHKLDQIYGDLVEILGISTYHIYDRLYIYQKWFILDTYIKSYLKLISNLFQTHSIRFIFTILLGFSNNQNRVSIE